MLRGHEFGYPANPMPPRANEALSWDWFQMLEYYVATHHESLPHLPTKPHWLASQHRTMYNAVLPRGTWALMAAMAKAPAQLCGLAKGSKGRSSFQGGELPSNTSSRWDLGHTGQSWEISVVAQLCLPVAFLCISVTFRAEPKMIAVAPNTKSFDLKKHHTMPHFLRYTDRRCHHVAWGMLTPRKVKSRHVGDDTVLKEGNIASWKTTYIRTQQLAHVLIQSHTLVYPANTQPYTIHQPLILRAWLPQPLLQQLDHRIWAREKWQNCYRPIRKFFISVPNTMPQGPQQPLAQTLAEGNQMIHQVVNHGDMIPWGSSLQEWPPGTLYLWQGIALNFHLPLLEGGGAFHIRIVQRHLELQYFSILVRITPSQFKRLGIFYTTFEKLFLMYLGYISICLRFAYAAAVFVYAGICGIHLHWLAYAMHMLLQSLPRRDPSSNSACLHGPESLREKFWRRLKTYLTLHKVKLATKNVAQFNFGSPLPTFASILPMSSYQPQPWPVLPHPGGRALHLRLTQQLPHLWVVGPCICVGKVTLKVVWMKANLLQ